jgi:hypothetical protein
VSEEIDLLKSARRLRIPTGICVGSWDKLTNKGMIKFVPERVFVWNDVQVREAVELHAIPRERVIATGAHPFDEWFERQPSMTREGFTGGLGLDPERPYVLYLCSSPLTTGSAEIEFVRRWIEQLRADPHLGGLGIAVRPHPNSADEWQGVDLSGYGGVAVCESRHPIADDARSAFFDSIAHSAAVVGINTTAMIEAAILGKSVLTILNREFAQETTLHFHYLLAENGGFLHVAPSLEAHAEQLRSVLREDAAGAERRRRFVEAFVRPRGIDRRAAPILIDAIEELARTDPDPVARAAILHRLALGAEAALTRLFLAGRGLVPRGDGRVRAPRAVDAARPRDVRA